MRTLQIPHSGLADISMFFAPALDMLARTDPGALRGTQPLSSRLTCVIVPERSEDSSASPHPCPAAPLICRGSDRARRPWPGRRVPSYSSQLRSAHDRAGDVRLIRADGEARALDPLRRHRGGPERDLWRAPRLAPDLEDVAVERLAGRQRLQPRAPGARQRARRRTHCKRDRICCHAAGSSRCGSMARNCFQTASTRPLPRYRTDEVSPVW